jgi:hypothetical protein
MSKTNLRKLAKEVPCCMGCGMQNPNGDLLCLAHSNALEDGRGAYHKSNDLFGAYLCDTCHKSVDIGHGLTKQEKRGYHKAAWVKTMRWWIKNG